MHEASSFNFICPQYTSKCETQIHIANVFRISKYRKMHTLESVERNYVARTPAVQTTHEERLRIEREILNTVIGTPVLNNEGNTTANESASYSLNQVHAMDREQEIINAILTSDNRQVDSPSCDPNSHIIESITNDERERIEQEMFDQVINAELRRERYIELFTTNLPQRDESYGSQQIFTISRGQLDDPPSYEEALKLPKVNETSIRQSFA